MARSGARRVARAAQPEKLDVNLQEPRTSEHVITEPFLGVPLYFSQHLVSRLSAARNLLAGFTDGTYYP